MATAAAVQRQAYVTLVTNDAYVIGALVLGHSLRRTQTERVLVCLVTDGVSDLQKYRLEDVFDQLVSVRELDSQDVSHLALLNRPELGVTFTKMHAFKLVQFDKCVFMDADTLVLNNVDDLFDKGEFAAAPDVGWPDCFNSGVFVFTPSQSTFSDLVAMADVEGSFDGGDQGLLNQYFSSWATSGPEARLSFGYNMTANASYGYAPAYARYRDQVRVVHFIGAHKPWNGVPSHIGNSGGLFEQYEAWWRAHDDFMTCCSESADYKTVVGYNSAVQQLPGSPSARTASDQGGPTSEHDLPKARFDPGSYLSSQAADSIVGRIAALTTAEEEDEGAAAASESRAETASKPKD
eukprot:TRINITY_DN11531_c1_g1_i6.p1 TRINITY_DN11531_c1_g1~~TRINITY_DN11531_c1_g1_i6.p1  ORF type:complete len:350 (+),score=93.54 TRINITY_DN11531_c1_g1_i6:85-1134(+)